MIACWILALWGHMLEEDFAKGSMERNQHIWPCCAQLLGVHFHGTSSDCQNLHRILRGCHLVYHGCSEDRYWPSSWLLSFSVRLFGFFGFSFGLLKHWMICFWVELVEGKVLGLPL
jgi:hypothetical protein